MTKTKVISNQVLSCNPLIFAEQKNLAVDLNKPNIFLGIGLCTPTKLSKTIPFDILGFLLTAEQIKRHIPNSKVFLLIGDQHAWLANNFNQNQVQKLAVQSEKTINQVIKNLKLSRWQVIIASNLLPKAKPASYEDLETRDVNHFFSKHQCGIKISWQFSSGKKDHKTDEAHFDQLLNIPIQTVSIKPGFTLNAQKPHQSPYICTDPIYRVILNPQEKVKLKLSSFESKIPVAQFQAVKNHLKRITILFEQLICKFPPKIPLEEKVQQIINTTFI